MRLSRYGGGLVATRRTVAWTGWDTAVAVDRRTLRTRTWQLPGGVEGTSLALTHARLWVNADDRRGRSVVLTGRLPR